jgi:hypothetical protein
MQHVQVGIPYLAMPEQVRIKSASLPPELTWPFLRSRQMRRVLGLMLALLPVAVFAQTAFDGTWKVEETKWQLDHSPILVEIKDGIFQCLTCTPAINIRADGTDQRVADDPAADTDAVTVVNANTVELVEKKDGEVTYHWISTLSDDGNTMERKVERSFSGSNSTYTVTLSRNAGAPAGAHALSGSWLPETIKTSDPLTRTFVSINGGLRYTGSDGEAYDASFNGKDYPVHGRGTKIATVSLKKIDAHTLEETYKRSDGKVVWVSRLSVSPDGKTLTQVSQDKLAGRINSVVANKLEYQEAEK